MLSIDSAHPQKVDGMHRNQWTTYSGFGGRLAPESVVAFDRITHNYRLALSRAKMGKNVILDSPIYQNQLFVELFIKDWTNRMILYQMGKIDLEVFPQPDIVIYLSSTKNSIMRFLNERKGKREWENDRWISLLQRMPAIVEKQMHVFKNYAGKYIRINREDFDFSNQIDFNKLLDLLSIKIEKQI